MPVVQSFLAQYTHYRTQNSFEMFNLIWKSSFVKETTQHLCSSSSNNVHAHEGNKSMEI